MAVVIAAAAFRMLEIQKAYEEAVYELGFRGCFGAATYYLSPFLRVMFPDYYDDVYPIPPGLVLTPRFAKDLEELTPWDVWVFYCPDNANRYVAVSAHLKRPEAKSAFKTCLIQEQLGVLCEESGKTNPYKFYPAPTEIELQTYLKSFKPKPSKEKQ